MTLYEILIELSKKKSRFKGNDGKTHGFCYDIVFDLDSKTVTNKKFTIISNGRLVVDEINLTDGTFYKVDEKELINCNGNFYDNLYCLFEQFISSVPGKRDSTIKSNFKALSVDKLSCEQIYKNMSRNEARVRLEAYIMLCAMTGFAKWEDDSHYFWKSDKDKRLILFKQWLVMEG